MSSFPNSGEAAGGTGRLWASRARRGPGKILRLAVIKLLLLCASATAFAQNWTFLYKADGIEVFTDGASPPTFKAEGILDVDVVDILAVFCDVPRRTEWVRNLGESRVIQDNHFDRALIYSRYNLPWPASDRDSLIETNYTNDYRNGEVTIQFHAVATEGEPPIKGVIRIPKVTGVLHLKILAKGTTAVRYEVNLDAGGWLPIWICNFFIRDAPIQMLRAMKQRISETKSLYREFKDAQIRLWHADRRD